MAKHTHLPQGSLEAIMRHTNEGICYENPRSIEEIQKRWVYMQQLFGVGTGYVRIFIAGTWLTTSRAIVSCDFEDQIEILELTPAQAVVLQGERVHYLRIAPTVHHEVWFQLTDDNMGPMPRLEAKLDELYADSDD